MPARRCPYCLADLDPSEEAVVACAACHTQHHRACFLEHGRCTLLGCTSTETTTDTSDPELTLASLHPFLPLEEGLVDRQASFLSVRTGTRDRKKRRGAKRTLSLQIPEATPLGRPIDGVLRGFTPKRIKGEGMRLVVRALLEAGGRKLVLGSSQAVVVGRAGKGWLSRLKLWSREPTELLLLPGETTFEISFDPTPLAWNGALPAGAPGPGPRLFLEVHGELDAAAPLRTETKRARLLDGRRPPSLLGVDDLLTLYAPTLVPPLAVDAEEGFSARPITTGSRKAEEVRPVAQIALHHRTHTRRPSPDVDAVDLNLEPLERGARSIRGAIDLDLHRAGLHGRLVLQLEVERRSYLQGKRVWRAYAREAAILSGGSQQDVDVSGRHAFDFEYPLPPSFFGGRAKDPRRVQLRAVLLGEGMPLRSVKRTARVEGVKA